MDFKKFAYNSVIRNFKSYLGYYLSSTISIMIFFAFAVSLFHPNVANLQISNGSTLYYSLITTETVISIVSLLFILYSLGTFIKGRFKEFGTLKIIGISDKQFRKLIFLEGTIIGLLSIASGIVLGLIFAKPFLSLTSSIFGIKATQMYVPVKAMLITIVLFAILFSISSPITMFLVKNKTIIELLNGSKKPKVEPKNSKLLAVLSIIILSFGYIGTRFEGMESIVIACVIVGTYLFFSQFTVFVLNIFKKNKKYYMNKTNLLWISNLVYKVKDNSRLLFLNTMLLSGTLVAISALSTVVATQLDDAKSMYPYILNLTSSDNNKAESEQIKIIEDTLHEDGYKFNKTHFKILNIGNSRQYVVRNSEFNRVGKKLGIDNVELKENETSIIPRFDTTKYRDGLKEINSLKVGSEDLKVKGIASNRITDVGMMDSLLVINDNMYSKLEKDKNNVTFNIIGYDYNNWEYSYKTSDKIEDGIKKISKNNYNTREYYNYFTNLPGNYNQEVQLNKALLFIGTFIGIIFFICSCSFLYFRFYTDLITDKEKYKNLSKIGLSYNEMKKTLNIEIGSMFFIPYFVGFLNAIFSVIMLSSAKGMNVGVKGLVVSFIFFAIYLVYFIALKSKYIKEIAKEIPGYLD